MASAIPGSTGAAWVMAGFGSGHFAGLITSAQLSGPIEMTRSGSAGTVGVRAKGGVRSGGSCHA